MRRRKNLLQYCAMLWHCWLRFAIAHLCVRLLRCSVCCDGISRNAAYLSLQRPNRSSCFKAIHHRHSAIHQNQIIRSSAQCIQSLFTVGHHIHTQSRFSQIFRNDDLIYCIVLSEENKESLLLNIRLRGARPGSWEELSRTNLDPFKSAAPVPNFRHISLENKYPKTKKAQPWHFSLGKNVIVPSTYRPLT